MFALALAGIRLAQELGSPQIEWHWYLAEALICIAGGLLVGRWWVLAVPLVVLTFVLPVERIFPLTFPDPYLLLATALGVGLRAVAGPLVRARGRVRLDGPSVAGLVLYVVSSAGFVGLALLGSPDVPFMLALSALAVVHLLCGFAIGRWSALLLPLLLVVLAIPVPTDPDAYEPIPLWFAMLFWFAPIGVAVLALGVGARRVVARWRPLR